VQLTALFTVLKLPEAHEVHIRSCVALPAWATDSPGEQLVHGMHAVAGLLSWSQVPGPHSSFGEASPAQ